MTNTGRRRYRKRQRTAGTDAAAGICLTLFLFSLAVVLILNAGWLYDLDITRLGLDRESGLSVAQIKENYDALIRYNRVWFRGDLIFPSLPMSREAAIHFAEVKRIFDGIQILCVVSGILSLIFGIRSLRNGSRRFFRIAGVLSLVIPSVLGVLALLFWDRFFILFHQLVFRNDYWLFDPATDPVILILPDTYFLHCAVGIVLMILLGSILCLLAGRSRRAGGSGRQAR